MLFRVVILAGLFALFGAACGSCDPGGFPDASLVDAPPTGTVTLSWTVTDPSGAPIRCEEIGGSFVFVQLRSRTGAPGGNASFACNSATGTSAGLAPGTYDVSFELHGTNLSSVTAPEQIGVVVASGQDTRLAPVNFAVDARGTLTITLATSAASNCRSPSMNGAGITATTITLEHTGGGCAPVTFVRMRGSTVVETYTVNCSSPRIATCIENNETLTSSDMTSGPYTIHVRGKVGAVDCWRNDNTLQVPPQRKVVLEPLNLAQTGTPGC